MLLPAQVEVTPSEQPDPLTDSRHWPASLPRRRLTFVSEDDVEVSGFSAGRRTSGATAADGGGGGEQLASFRTASWEALARWDEAGSRRGSERDLLEALLGTAAGAGDDVSAVPPPHDAVGVLVRRWAEAVGTVSNADPAPDLGAPPLHRPLRGCETGIQPGPGEVPPSNAGGVALLSAPHVSRLASLLTAAPAALPALHPMLSSTVAPVAGQAAVDEVRHDHREMMPGRASFPRPAAQQQHRRQFAVLEHGLLPDAGAPRLWPRRWHALAGSVLLCERLALQPSPSSLKAHCTFAQETAQPSVMAAMPLQDSHRHSTTGVGAETIDPVAMPGAALMYQAAALLGSPLSRSIMDPHSTAGHLMLEAPEMAEQLAGQSLGMPPNISSETQRRQQRQQQHDSQAVRHANAAWTAATWRLISGQQPQP